MIYDLKMTEPLNTISKELSLSIPMDDISVDMVKNINISNMIGEFYHNNKNIQKNSISNIISELISNSMKYSRKNSDIKITTYMNTENSVYMVVENICSNHQLRYLKSYISTITHTKKDIESLYIDRVLKLSKRQKLGRAQLGLLSLMTNFNCALDIKTDTIDTTQIVTTMVVFKGVENG